MEKQNYTEITDAVYKLLDFFPEEEPLAVKIKEKALAIMENAVLAFLPNNPHPDTAQKVKAGSQVLKDIEVLRSYFYLAKERGWMENLNLLIISKEYDRIKEEIRPIAELITEENRKPAFAKSPTLQSYGDGAATAGKAEITGDNNVDKAEETVFIKKLSDRQQEILKILKIQEKAQVADFKKVLVNVSKRTIRRDLDDLLKKQKVVRVGEWNQVFYRIPESSRGLASGNVDRTALMS